MKLHENYKICSTCVMDTSDPEITFGSDGRCNHCTRYENLVAARVVKDDGASFDQLIAGIKARGKKSKFDCVIGISGGVDSSYLLKLAFDQGLRILAVHVDNGWNTELAVTNIKNMVQKTGVAYHTEILDWNEFKALQLSFLRGDTPDGEIPTDHAIDATLWRIAHKFGVKTILSGMNFETEALSVPSWAYGHSDIKYIKDVHQKMGGKPLQNFPYYTLFYLAYLTYVRKIKIISPLNYRRYDKEQAKIELIEQFGWRPYEGKHFESIYTRLYQGYILPKKFNIDKRRGHLSDLINSKQITRDDAMKLLDKPILPDEIIKSDIKYLIDKFDINLDEFNKIMRAQPRKFHDYRNNYTLVQLARRSVNILRKLNLYPR